MRHFTRICTSLAAALLVIGCAACSPAGTLPAPVFAGRLSAAERPLLLCDLRMEGSTREISDDRVLRLYDTVTSALKEPIPTVDTAEHGSLTLSFRLPENTYAEGETDAQGSYLTEEKGTYTLYENDTVLISPMGEVSVVLRFLLTDGTYEAVMGILSETGG